MEKTQNIQNSQYSPYVRGLVVGSLAGGTLVAGALAINSFVHSTTQIPTGMSTAASMLKEISISVVGGISGLLSGRATSYIVAKNISGQIRTGPSTMAQANLFAKALSALSGATAGCVTLTFARLIERLL